MDNGSREERAEEKIIKSDENEGLKLKGYLFLKELELFHFFSVKNISIQTKTYVKIIAC